MQKIITDNNDILIITDRYITYSEFTYNPRLNPRLCTEVDSEGKFEDIYLLGDELAKCNKLICFNTKINKYIIRDINRTNFCFPENGKWIDASDGFLTQYLYLII